MEDKQIIALLLAGEAAGMEALQEKYIHLLRYVCRGILRDERDVEECVNDVCLSLWNKAASYTPDKGRLTTWLTVLTRNAALNRRLALERRQCWESDEDPAEQPTVETPESALLAAEARQRLLAVIRELSSEEYALFYRKYYYMQPLSQISAEMGLSLRAVEGRLYRLREKLRRKLGEYPLTRQGGENHD